MRVPEAAIVGLGFVGKAHAEALRRLRIPLRGVLEASPEMSEMVARGSGAVHAYRNLEELLGDERVSVVHVCTPNDLHHEMASRALASGKHVLCEKPLALNSDQVSDLLNLAKRGNLVGAVCYNLRYYPLCQQARAMIDQGAIGEPRLVHGSYLQDWLFMPTDWNWRLDPELGGSQRAIADIGSHWLDLAEWLTGRKVTRLCADMATVVPARLRPARATGTFQGELDPGSVREEVRMSTDDYASVLLHFEDGMHGALAVSQVSAGRKNRLWIEVDGSQASIAWDSEAPNQLWVGRREEANDLLLKDPALLSPSARKYAGYPGGHAEGYPDTFLQLFKEFYGYISKGDLDAPRTFPTFKDGYRGVRLCEAVSRSVANEAWVDLPV